MKIVVLKTIWYNPKLEEFLIKYSYHMDSDVLFKYEGAEGLIQGAVDVDQYELVGYL